MSNSNTFRLRRVLLALLALVAVSFVAPAAFARGSLGISLSVPGIGISYSDHGRYGHQWGGYVSGGYSSYNGYYGGSPYYSSYYDPYYRPAYRPAHRGYYGGRSYYRPSRVVYYDRHDRGRRGHHGRYDDRRHDRDGWRDRRASDDGRDGRRGGYYDRGR